MKFSHILETEEMKFPVGSLATVMIIAAAILATLGVVGLYGVHVGRLPVEVVPVAVTMTKSGFNCGIIGVIAGVAYIIREQRRRATLRHWWNVTT